MLLIARISSLSSLQKEFNQDKFFIVQWVVDIDKCCRICKSFGGSELAGGAVVFVEVVAGGQEVLSGDDASEDDDWGDDHFAAHLPD